MHTSDSEIFCAGMSLSVLMWDLQNRCIKQYHDHQSSSSSADDEKTSDELETYEEDVHAGG